MAKFIDVKSHEEFYRTLKELPEHATVFAEFYGAHDSTGKSWCPDCVRAEPVIATVMKTKAPRDSFLLRVSVGDRAAWKTPDSPFRIDPQLKLKCIPTVIRWGTNQILVDRECADASTVTKFVAS